MAKRRQKTSELGAEDRLKVLRRDPRCLNCGKQPVTLQHRRAKGMGGISNKAEPLTPADGVGLCWDCNRRCEGDLRELAVQYGWKIPRFWPVLATEVPYYDRTTGNWWLADVNGGREWIATDIAVDTMVAIIEMYGPGVK